MGNFVLRLAQPDDLTTRSGPTDLPGKSRFHIRWSDVPMQGYMTQFVYDTLYCQTRRILRARPLAGGRSHHPAEGRIEPSRSSCRGAFQFHDGQSADVPTTWFWSFPPFCSTSRKGPAAAFLPVARPGHRITGRTAPTRWLFKLKQTTLTRPFVAAFPLVAILKFVASSKPNIKGQTIWGQAWLASNSAGSGCIHS